MEATGVYWKPVWHVLEGRFELVLANALHVRNVPGRKSDVNDAIWIADLLAHGLIRAQLRAAGRRAGAAGPHPHPQAARARDDRTHPADPEDAGDGQPQAHRRPHRHPGGQRPRDPAGPDRRRDRSRALGARWPAAASRPRRPSCAQPCTAGSPPITASCSSCTWARSMRSRPAVARVEARLGEALAPFRSRRRPPDHHARASARPSPASSSPRSAST